MRRGGAIEASGVSRARGKRKQTMSSGISGRRVTYPSPSLVMFFLIKCISRWCSLSLPKAPKVSKVN